MNKYLNLPNFLTFSRLILLFPMIIFLFLNNKILAFFIYLLIWISDILDGYFARKLKIFSDFGEKLDLGIDAITSSLILIILLFINNLFNSLSITYLITSGIYAITSIILYLKKFKFFDAEFIQKSYAVTSLLLITSLIFNFNFLINFSLYLSIFTLFTLLIYRFYNSFF